MKIETSTWDHRNTWQSQSGETITRPGADNLFLMGGASSDYTPHAGFSLKLQFVDSTIHYILATNHQVDPAFLEMHVIDENLSNTKRKQVIKLGWDEPIRAISHAIVNGQIIISGPNIPTLWGYTGSGLIVADKENSVNPAVETLAMPNGICVGWYDRCVIAKGEALFISEPMAPRTYTVGGYRGLNATVYGVHVSPSGALVAVTAGGVYGLDSQAAAQGAKVIGAMTKLSDYRAVGYGRTAMTPFGLFGLTKRGVKRIDIEGAEEVLLSDKTYVRSLSDMISFPDYREGRLYSTSSGLAVSVGTLDQDDDGAFGGGICMLDLERGIKSWWTQKGITRIIGVMQENEGDDIFLMERAAGSGSEACVYKYHLDYDSDDPSSQYFGGVAGVMVANAELSPVIRAIYTEADNGGALLRSAVRGEYRKNNGSNQEIVTDTNGVIIGVDEWKATAAGTKRLKTRELDSYRFQFAKRTNDISVETSAQGGKVRIGSMSLATGGYGQGRPT